MLKPAIARTTLFDATFFVSCNAVGGSADSFDRRTYSVGSDSAAVPQPRTEVLATIAETGAIICFCQLQLALRNRNEVCWLPQILDTPRGGCRRKTRLIKFFFQLQTLQPLAERSRDGLVSSRA